MAVISALKKLLPTVNNETLTKWGKPVNLTFFGWNFGQLFGWLKFDKFNFLNELFDLTNINLVVTIVVGLMAGLWWKIRIKNERLQKELRELEKEKMMLEIANLKKEN